MIHIVKPVGLKEIEQFEGCMNPDFVDRGYGVFSLNGDTETLIEWFADRWAADAMALELDEENDESDQ